ncbi:PH domain-containing protein [Cutibacterium porci]|uniref:PH domain-containing protein n=1 Tax=Cutibacterium porci TaxID=2605781 RepID=UPI002DDB44BB|nr:PH domain-containing protein [Cutibacterium porci]
MDELFTPPGGEWHPVSKNYVTIKRLMVLLTWGVLTVVIGIALGFFVTWWVGILAAIVGVAFTGWRCSRMPAVVAAMGWCERGSDLCIRSGPWFRKMVIVPYGRMQAVEVNAGPVDRHWAVASVQLVTAATATSASIDGLPVEEARALRDRITDMAGDKDAAL